jgi:transcription termination factor Rho
VNDRSTPKTWEDIPFGALDLPAGITPPQPKPAAPPAAPSAPSHATPAQQRPNVTAAPGEDRDWRRPENRRGRGRRGGRRRRLEEGALAAGATAPGEASESEHDEAEESGGEARDVAPGTLERATDERGSQTDRANDAAGTQSANWDESGRWQGGGRRRRRRGRRGRGAHGFQGQGSNDQGASVQGSNVPSANGISAAGEDPESAAEFADHASTGTAAPALPRPAGVRAPHERHGRDRGQQERAAPQVLSGMLVIEKGGWGVMRRLEAQYLPSKEDIWVAPHWVQRFKLREGSVLTGVCGRGQQHKYQLNQLEQVDGKEPREVMNVVPFKKLTSIDPDFHYGVGDVLGDVSMRVLDVICPVGRGSRGLIVAPPRSGKTILMRKFANAISEGFPEVQLMVLLVDERPEEATEWQRTTKGQVFVSTNDEDTKNHVELAEVVFKRCQRLVELGQDVVLLLDSITRLARAYNNHLGNSGKTMSGGLDSRAMERPRAFFGMARNTETAGSLTILGTTLVDTGSRMDQMVFEEFKGTGNMEIVLSRKLADRRIFPAIDIEKSGTRKEEKLHSATRLRRVHVLRRVLLKMNFVEAMELLIAKLEDVEKTDDFLKRFDVDPEA